MDLLTMALRGARIHGARKDFDIGFVFDKHGMVMDAGTPTHIDYWLIENRPENGHCFKQDLCEKHSVPALSPMAKLLAETQAKYAWAK